MARTTSVEAPVAVTLVIVPGFALHALALCVDALRIANREALRTAFDWAVASEDGAPVASSSGVAIAPDLALERIDRAPVTVLLAAYDPEEACTDRLVRWLRRQDRQRGAIGCVDTGALILARAGLVGDAEVSVHHAALEGMREDFPASRFAGAFTDRIYAFEGRRFSSGGGVGVLDMMLALIEHHESRTLADRVAHMMNHDRRGPRTVAPGEPVARPAHPALARCVDLMHANLEDPLSLDQIGAVAGVPLWTMRRLFRRHLQTTPSRYYRDLRLDRARSLLAYSHLSVAEIAAACGFAEIASLTRAFSRRFGAPPSRRRRDEAGLPEPIRGAPGRSDRSDRLSRRSG